MNNSITFIDTTQSGTTPEQDYHEWYLKHSGLPRSRQSSVSSQEPKISVDKANTGRQIGLNGIARKIYNKLTPKQKKVADEFLPKIENYDDKVKILKEIIKIKNSS